MVNEHEYLLLLHNFSFESATFGARPPEHFDFAPQLFDQSTMMDFDLAASRLAKDQKSALERSRAQRAARTSSAKAKREAAASRAKAEQRIQQKKFEAEKKARIVGRVIREVERVEKRLGVVGVGAKIVNDSPASLVKDPAAADVFEKSPLANGWKMDATSIHGEGDKIALPPSVLEELTSGSNGDLDPWTGQSGRPISFRVGILNPNYGGFPSSAMMKSLVEKVSAGITLENSKSTVSEASEGQTSQQLDEELEVSEDEVETSWREAYLDELSCRYIAYTHGTVVEFTQEDGCVGLPEPIARALLFPNAYSLVKTSNCSAIETKRTVDPAAEVATNSIVTDDDKPMEVDSNDDEKTPGHPAYGKFEVPAAPIEVTPIKSLPPGKDCTFTPTEQSIKNGFYALKDVKSVLEQSLMRTRATLSRGDVIRTWRRGVSFDLIVSKLAPVDYAKDYGVVSCVNTDLNVDIGPPEGIEKKETETDEKPVREQSTIQANGRTLAESSLPLPASLPSGFSEGKVKQIELPPEPPESETEGVCVVQIRGRGNISSGRRRFKTNNATIGDLFAFASNILGGDESSSFQLATRFPRKVYKLSTLGDEDSYNPEDTLESAGIIEGQVLFMIEQ
jgi:hypothetical protein